MVNDFNMLQFPLEINKKMPTSNFLMAYRASKSAVITLYVLMQFEKKINFRLGHSVERPELYKLKKYPNTESIKLQRHATYVSTDISGNDITDSPSDLIPTASSNLRRCLLLLLKKTSSMSHEPLC